MPERFWLLSRNTARIFCVIGIISSLVVITAATPAHGYSEIPLESVEPPAFWQDACPGNLIVNPNFEGGGRKTEDLGTSLSSSVAHGWFPWFIRGDQRFNREPEFKLEDATADPLRWRVHDGYFSQKFFTTWATHTAGIYQRVPVQPGSVVNFSIWVQVYTGENDGWDGQKHHSDPNAPGNYRTLIGIDPFGNTPAGVGAPPPDTVVWSDTIMVYDAWTRMGVQAVAQADHVTVYTRGQPEFSVKHNDSFWDTACLFVGGSAPVAAAPAPPIDADAVVNTPVLNFRAGPGTEYDIIGALRQGDPLTVEARLADNSWLNVIDGTGTVGWVFTGLLQVGIDLAGVPVAQDIPPTPTPAPTETPEPTPTPLPTDTPEPSPTPTEFLTDTPAPSLTPVSVAVATGAPEGVVRAEESRPGVAEERRVSDSAGRLPSDAAESRLGDAFSTLNCVTAMIAAGVGMLGVVIWPRRRRGR